MRQSSVIIALIIALQSYWAVAAFQPAAAQVPALGPPPAASASSSGLPPPPGLPAPPGSTAPAGAPPSVGGIAPEAASASTPLDRPAVARVRKGSGVLPNDHGQVWREYDISPYTARVKQVERPEQTIIDWILRETGTELWFSEPLGILSANRGTLRVYNTPDVQRVVAGIVDRFVNSSTETQSVGLRLATIGSPNWRTRAYPIMRSVSAQAAGVEAWLLSKENAALLISELSKRPDYREYSTPSLTVVNGMQQNVTRTRPRTYVKSFRPKDPSVGGYESDMAQLDEGFKLDVSPLFSLDARSVDVQVKCQVDQVEKFVPVVVDIPAFGGQWQRSQVQVPQLVSWRLNERFRWPTDQVLLLSCGVVASPVPEAKSTTNPLANLWSTPASRSDALLFVECVGAAGAAASDPTKATAGGQPATRGRY
ncbi:MAG: hypothetical protein U0939_01895 [Pirellulales bacterium]